MKGRIDNKMGSIQIDPEVIAMYAGTTAVRMLRYRWHGGCQYERWSGKTA